MKNSILALGFAAGLSVGPATLATESGLSEVIVIAPDPQASEMGGNPATFYIARNEGNLDVPLVVSFTVTGSAANGGDYAKVPLSVTLPPNKQLSTVTIAPIADASNEGLETVTLTLVAKPGLYRLGDDTVATASMADSTGSAGSPPTRRGGGPGKSTGTGGGGKGGSSAIPPGGFPGGVPPADFDATTRLPPPDRTGTLTVSVTFHAAGKWSSKYSGAYSNLRWFHSFSYSVPLRGIYSPGSGFEEVERRQKGGIFVPNLKRYLMLKPRDLLGPAGRSCGKGESKILDESNGMEVGDPGMPPLVPFTHVNKGGGPFPSGDKTVPERDLCQSAVSFDYEKNVFHLRIDGSDAHVKVRSFHNGREPGHPYNVRLQGDDTVSGVKSKLTFLDQPMAANAMGIEGNRVIENFSFVRGPENSQYPVSATVRWKVTLQ
jgi:hypothetical protein